MGFDIGVATTEYLGNEDRRWLGIRAGTENCRSVTLDPALFVAAHTADKGMLPSGTVLAKVTATGLYGPYDPAADDGREIEANCLLLFNSTKLGDTPVGVPGFWGPGVVKQSFLPAFTGTVAGEIHADVRAAMTHIRFEA